MMQSSSTGSSSALLGYPTDLCALIPSCPKPPSLASLSLKTLCVEISYSTSVVFPLKEQIIKIEGDVSSLNQVLITFLVTGLEETN